jgi:hypothetical protein
MIGYPVTLFWNGIVAAIAKSAAAYR